MNETINNTTKEFIDYKFGVDGFLITTVTESALLKNSDKLQALKAMLDCDCHQYLQYLDKLYASLGKPGYEIIIVLKQMHDIYHNNEVKMEEDLGVCYALVRWYGTILPDGTVFDDALRDKFRALIKRLVDEHILALEQSLETGAVEPSNLLMEQGEADLSWRTEMRLPLAQMPAHSFTSRFMSYVSGCAQATNREFRFFGSCLFGVVMDFQRGLDPNASDDDNHYHNGLY